MTKRELLDLLLVDKIQRGDWIAAKRLSNRRTVFTISLNGRLVRVVYHKDKHCIFKFLGDDQ